MRILIIEDDKHVAGFVGRGLKENGHVVELADNGPDGHSLAASENFDAIILDRMLLGGIDDLEILVAEKVDKPFPTWLIQRCAAPASHHGPL